MDSIEKGFFYHIFNRGAGKADLFYSSRDFRLFLQKYFYYLYPCIQTYAWCLMKNHFHAVIRVRTIEEQISVHHRIKTDFSPDNFHGSKSPEIKSYVASKQISHLINSYTKNLNRRIGRSGTLIEGPLKRKKLIDEDHLVHLICYTHRNPIHHGVSNSYSEYPYFSYRDFFRNQNSFLEKRSVLNLFGGKGNFIEAHQEFKIKLGLGEDFYLE